MTLSARRFVVNRAAMGRARFMFYPWFIFFFIFFFFVCDQTQTPHSAKCRITQLPKNCWKVNVLKIVWIFYSLFNRKYIAFLCYWSAWFEASIEYTKRNYVIHGMCRLCNFLLGSVLNNIVLVTPAMECSFHFGYVSTIVLTFLQVYFARSGSH